MIGTGVFTSLGFQLIEMQSAPVLLMLWLVGGISALCGALCYAELGAALPHAGGAYSFGRSAFGPWGGFVAGLACNIEYVLTPAVIVVGIGGYLGTVFETPPAWAPAWWLGAYALFVGLNGEQTQRVAGSCAVASFDAGEPLWAKGDAPESMAIVDTAGSIVMTRAPASSAARSDPGPLSSPFVTV